MTLSKWQCVFNFSVLIFKMGKPCPLVGCLAIKGRTGAQLGGLAGKPSPWVAPGLRGPWVPTEEWTNLVRPQPFPLCTPV